jgi:hypothetical protein
MREKPNLNHFDNIAIGGISHLKAWKKGVIPSLLAENGGDLNDAMRKAEAMGACVYENTVHNLVVQDGLEIVCDWALDIEATGLTYHAIGTGAATPASGDSALTTEVARKTWTSKTRAAAVMTYSEFYLASECTYNIKECGVWGGATATATLGSGVLFAHYLQTYDNSAGLVDLTFEYELEVKYA